MNFNNTFNTLDFKIYVFDKNDTGIKGVLKTNVEDLYSSISNIKKVAFISPANSLLFMDGGVDKGYMNCIDNIQEKAQLGVKKLGIKTLLGRFYLPIGSTMSITINNNTTLISAPTMFLPQKVLKTENPYYALKSALQLCKYLNIKYVFCPMMATGYGGISYKDSFELMTKAVNEYSLTTGNFREKYNYTYNILDNHLTKLITDQQPKIYCNTEFYVNLQF